MGDRLSPTAGKIKPGQIGGSASLLPSWRHTQVVIKSEASLGKELASTLCAASSWNFDPEGGRMCTCCTLARPVLVEKGKSEE